MAEWIFFNRQIKPSKKIAQEYIRDLEKTGMCEKVKESIVKLFGKGDLYFTSEDADFQVHFSHYMEFIRETGRTHVLTPATDHFESLKQLSKLELVHKPIPVNENGQLTKTILESHLRARSSMLSLYLAHPLTGVIQPIDDLIAVCRENDIRVHININASLGKLYHPELDADFLTFGSLNAPISMGAILANTQFIPTTKQSPSYAEAHAFESAIKETQSQLEHFAMEIAYLRNELETKLEELGAKIFFKEVERLPNTAVFAFENVHAESLLFALKRQGLFLTTGDKELKEVLKACGIDPKLSASAIAAHLNADISKEQIDRALSIIETEVEKLSKLTPLFSEEDANSKQMRVCNAGAGTEETNLTLSLLIDEEDGVIADTRFQVFGPSDFFKIAKAASSLLIRKNYMQARRLSADLIEKEAGTSNPTYLNLILEAIDRATEKCMDIPIEDVYVAPPEMAGGERQEYPGWETLTDPQKMSVISQVVATEIQPYVELDAGGVEVIKVEDNRIHIAYSGNCTSCYSATGATLDAIGNILRHKIYPDLMVIPKL